ncbi:hypothetical protein KM043_008235 [Ampulex compressa]|nr:hypothetical protein KM043_008235 [Ampulex compressa]
MVHAGTSIRVADANSRTCVTDVSRAKACKVGTPCGVDSRRIDAYQRLGGSTRGRGTHEMLFFEIFPVYRLENGVNREKEDPGIFTCESWKDIKATERRGGTLLGAPLWPKGAEKGEQRRPEEDKGGNKGAKPRRKVEE